MDIHDASFPFTARLARDNGWTNDYAARVVLEYKKFIFLCYVAGHQVTPSDEVDQAWHLHLVYSRSYWNDMCRDTIGRPIHHGPTKGGNAERAKYKDNYANTLECYRKHFESEPPADIWPTGKQRFSEINFTRVNTHRNWVVPKAMLPIHPVAAAVIIVLLMVAPFFIFALSDWVPHLFAALLFLGIGIALNTYLVFLIKNDMFGPIVIWKRVKERKSLGKPAPIWHVSMIAGLIPFALALILIAGVAEQYLAGLAVAAIVFFFFWYKGMSGMYLSKRKNVNEHTNTDGGYSDSGCGTYFEKEYDDPSDYDGSWGDSGCGGASGCSGDSGCSGCGGCGGCGGCS